MHYKTSFECALSAQKVTDKISELVKQKHNNLQVVDSPSPSAKKIVLRSINDNYLFKNSYVPIVDIMIQERSAGVRLCLCFRLRKSICVLLSIFTLMLLLMEAVLLVNLINGQLAEIALYFMPFLLFILNLAICILGLYFSSKRVLETIFLDLNEGEFVKIPTLRLSFRCV